MAKRINRLIYWAPRILGIIFVAFLALFSLDVFQPGLSFWEIALGLLIHNIPALILLAAVIIAWRHELVGAVVFTLAGLLYVGLTTFQAIRNPEFPWYLAASWSVQIAVPAFLTGILFFINWRMKKKT